MGTVISLRIGKLEVAWSKNEFLLNHSCLYKITDKKLAEYYYEESVERKSAFCRKLGDMVGRLELLGYHEDNLSDIYERHKSSYPDYYPKLDLDFALLSRILSSVDVNKIVIDPGREYYDMGEFLRVSLLKDPEFQKIKDIVTVHAFWPPDAGISDGAGFPSSAASQA